MRNVRAVAAAAAAAAAAYIFGVRFMHTDNAQRTGGSGASAVARRKELSNMSDGVVCL